MNILAISGSLRKASFNTMLLHEAARVCQSATIEVASIADIPLYNGDIESEEGIPSAVTTLQDRLEQADGLMLASPEYNNGVPGVLKNTIDWLSRPSAKIDIVFARKPLAMMGASMGGFGTVLAQAGWLPTIRTLGLSLWADETPFLVSRAHKAFDEQGQFINDTMQQKLHAYVEGFVTFIATTKC
ncbi:MAG: FMN reductase [Nitrospirales bacterium]|nr:MAG: FMN reductase [Nitrospirales bacterium]